MLSLVIQLVGSAGFSLSGVTLNGVLGSAARLAVEAFKEGVPMTLVDLPAFMTLTLMRVVVSVIEHTLPIHEIYRDWPVQNWR